MHTHTPTTLTRKLLPFWAKMLLVCTLVFQSSGSLLGETYAAEWQTDASISGNIVSTGIWGVSSIVEPEVDEIVMGSTTLLAFYVDENGDGNDGVQWAVREGTCAAGTNTVFGNVDGENTPFTWDGVTFSAEIDTTLVPDGMYCFVFNPSEDAGNTNQRLTRTFFIDNEPDMAPLQAQPSSVVLNEFVPNPTGTDSDDKPAGEWVELYNNNAFDVDLTGWYVTDSSGASTTGIVINDANAVDHLEPETAIIPAEGFLVVYLNKALLNNDGDTVQLFNSADELQDSYEYSGAVAEGKSFARLVDGTGPWVDPEPTPGEKNRFSRQDLVDAGFSDSEIDNLVALLAAHGEYLIGEEPKEEEGTEPGNNKNATTTASSTPTELVEGDVASSTASSTPVEPIDDETASSTDPDVGDDENTPEEGEGSDESDEDGEQASDDETGIEEPIRKEDETPLEGGDDQDTEITEGESVAGDDGEDVADEEPEEEESEPEPEPASEPVTE